MKKFIFAAVVAVVCNFGVTAGADEREEKKAVCDGLYRQIAYIDAKARQQHNGAEGQRLKEERRELRKRIVEEKCK